jgi:hypothetical protein
MRNSAKPLQPGSKDLLSQDSKRQQNHHKSEHGSSEMSSCAAEIHENSMRAMKVTREPSSIFDMWNKINPPKD